MPPETQSEDIILLPPALKPKTKTRTRKKVESPANLPVGESSLMIVPKPQSFFRKWGSLIVLSLGLAIIIIDTTILNASFLTTNYSWRWALRVNLFVVALLLAGPYLIKSVRHKDQRPGLSKLDDIGIILSSVGLLSIVFAIIESSTYGWWRAKEVFSIGNQTFPLSGNFSIVLPALIYGIIVLALFFWWENYTEKKNNMPLVSLSIFRNRQFTTGAITTALMTMSFAGILFSVPIFLQAVRHLDAIHTGLALLPMFLGILITAPLAAFLSNRIPPKKLIQAGFIINLIGLSVLYLSLNVNATVWTLAPGLAIFGLGMGFIFSQLNNLTLSAVSVSEAGEASGLSNTLRQLGQTLGFAMIGAVLISSLSVNLIKGVDASTTIVKGNQEALVYSILFTIWAFVFSFSLPKVKLISDTV